MGRRIIKQPDGKYAIWSSVVDDFILVNATKEYLIAEREKEAASQAREETLRELEEIERGTRRFLSPANWQEALSTRKRVHGRHKDFQPDPLK